MGKRRRSTRDSKKDTVPKIVKEEDDQEDRTAEDAKNDDQSENDADVEASSPVRQPQKRRRIPPSAKKTASGHPSVEEMEEEDSEQSPIQTQKKSPRRSTRHTLPPKARSQDDEDDSNYSHDKVDEDDDANDGLETPPGSPTEAKRSGRGPVQERTCPHCGKVFTTPKACSYHLDHMVCRNDKRGAASKDTEARKWKRFRGKKEDRTCTFCNRVFTSVLGLNYHVKNKVCQQKQKSKVDNDIVLPTLAPGTKFVTHFGVVEVVKDDRAIPTGVTANLPKKGNRSYAQRKTKTDLSNSKNNEIIAVNLRIRRRRIDSLYASDNLNRDGMFFAYFDGNPKEKLVSAAPPVKLTPIPKDPSHLEESFPNRIVECRLCPDLRKRYASNNLDTPLESNENSTSSALGRTTLFLQRKLLTEEYNDSGSTYFCERCGRVFLSVPGLKYHVTSDVCKQKGSSERRKREEREARIQNAIQGRLRGPSTVIRKKQRSLASLKSKQEKVRKKKALAIYPEALLSLGFKVVKKDVDFDGDARPFSRTKAPSEQTLREGGLDELSIDTGSLDGMDIDEPSTVLEHLRMQLQVEKRQLDMKTADLKHGALYSEVFKSLGFTKPRKRKADRVPRSSKLRRKSTKPAHPPQPMPPIIDTRALADEVDAGRYPSVKRNRDQDHANFCVLCKDGGELFCCDFCTNTEHLKCIRLKFTVKDPEPEDDFMCHKCIQNVLMKRTRAEKRRLEKQKKDQLRKQQQVVEDSKRNPGLQKGMEYPYMAARGQEVSELVVLLQDARNRLRQSVATSRMNNVRRRMMGLSTDANDRS